MYFVLDKDKSMPMECFVTCLGCNKKFNKRRILMHISHAKKCKMKYNNEQLSALKSKKSGVHKNIKNTLVKKSTLVNPTDLGRFKAPVASSSSLWLLLTVF